MSAEQPDPDEDARRRFDERELLREAEEAAAQLERSTRTFRDVIDAAMLAGQSVALDVGAITVTGLPVGTSESLVQIQSIDKVIRYTSLAAVTGVEVGEVVRRSVATHVEDMSLVKLLRTYTATPPDGSVRITTTTGRTWTGHLVGVSEDHVEAENVDGHLWALRLEFIAVIDAD